MENDLIAQEVLKILMESGIFRDEETAIQALEAGPKQWVEDLTEMVSNATETSLRDLLRRALEARDFKKARDISRRLRELAGTGSQVSIRPRKP